MFTTHSAVLRISNVSCFAVLLLRMLNYSVEGIFFHMKAELKVTSYLGLE